MARYTIKTVENYKDYFPQNRRFEASTSGTNSENSILDLQTTQRILQEWDLSKGKNMLEKIIAIGLEKPINLSSKLRKRLQELALTRGLQITLIAEPEVPLQSQVQHSLSQSSVHSNTVLHRMSYSGYLQFLIRALCERGFTRIKDSHEPLSTDINFHKLKMNPESFPDYSLKDTFFIDSSKVNEYPSLVLKTHATGFLLNELAKNRQHLLTAKTSFTVSRVFRRQTEDATHKTQFYQLDAQRNVFDSDDVAQLGSFVSEVLSTLGLDVSRVQLRNTRFAYTSPSYEIVYVRDPSKGFTAENTLEIGGCGVLRPSVLAGYNFSRPTTVSNVLALGLGLERIYLIVNSPDGCALRRVDKI